MHIDRDNPKHAGTFVVIRRSAKVATTSSLLRCDELNRRWEGNLNMTRSIHGRSTTRQ